MTEKTQRPPPQPLPSDLRPLFNPSTLLRLAEIQEQSLRTLAASQLSLNRTLQGVQHATSKLNQLTSQQRSQEDLYKAERLLAHEGVSLKEHGQRLNNAAMSITFMAPKTTANSSSNSVRPKLLCSALQKRAADNRNTLLQTVLTQPRGLENMFDEFVSEEIAKRKSSVLDMLTFGHCVHRRGGAGGNMAQEEPVDERLNFDVALEQYANAMISTEGTRVSEQVRSLAEVADVLRSSLSPLWRELHYLVQHPSSHLYVNPDAANSNPSWAFVIAVRQLLEMKFDVRLFKDVMHLTPEESQQSTNVKMTAEKYRAAARMFCQQHYKAVDEWMVTFHCIKAGRLDAAAHTTIPYEGAEIVSTTLSSLHALSREDRQLYSSPQCAQLLFKFGYGNPFRATVLMMLASNHLNSVQLETEFSNVVNDVTMYGEDMIWLRLCFIRPNSHQRGLASLEALQQHVLHSLGSERLGDNTQSAMLTSPPPPSQRILSEMKLFYVQLFPQQLRMLSTKISRIDLLHVAIAFSVCGFIHSSKVYDLAMELTLFLKDALHFACRPQHSNNQMSEWCKFLGIYFTLYPPSIAPLRIAEILIGCNSLHNILVGTLLPDGTVHPGYVVPALLNKGPQWFEILNGTALAATRMGEGKLAALLWVLMWKENQSTERASGYLVAAMETIMSDLNLYGMAVYPFAVSLAECTANASGVPPVIRMNFVTMCHLARTLEALESRNDVITAIETISMIPWIPQRTEDVPNCVTVYTSEAMDVVVNVTLKCIALLVERCQSFTMASSTTEVNRKRLPPQRFGALMVQWARSVTTRHPPDFISTLTQRVVQS
eukprot:PhF_6_TR10839/c0_g1_i1/m.17503